ncbi:hypothetical protein FQN54_001385 [Arachnomyces sp. PD_36]|nr:hypothetical protein FQN54_001385 [Arachnomyces sp. PD_36]
MLPQRANNVTIPYSKLVSAAPLKDAVTRIVERQAAITWDQSIKKGKELWKLLYDEPETKDKEYEGDELNTYYEHKGDEGTDKQPPKTIHQSLERDKISIKDWTLLSVVQQDDATKSKYKNYYYFDKEKQEGVIVAEDNNREGGEAKLYWADVAFLQYKETKDVKAANLKYIYQVTITNTDTNGFIDKAIGKKSYSEEFEECNNHGGSPDSWYRFDPGSDEFFALIGSANGRGAMHMLHQNPITFPRKTIVEVWVRPYTYAMKIVIGNM